jgi:hypothetical protein
MVGGPGLSKIIEKSISNAIPTAGRIITLWMFFPFTGGSGGSNFGQKARISEFVGKHPQKSKTGGFPGYRLI